ncbi:hypothetical protein L7F22_000490 [Adiantum nelumboides]|nr:hypothetical protein [Adiantum nelumboides]
MLKIQNMETLEASKQLKCQLAKLNEEIQRLRVQAKRSDELEKQMNLLCSQCVQAEGVTQDLKREADFLKSERSSLLEEKKSLSSVLLEKAQKVELLEDALRVKNKMLDSQNDSIKELKSIVANSKKQLVDRTAALEGLEAKLLRQLQEEADQVHALQTEVTEQEVVISELEEELQGHKQAKVAAETSKIVLEQRLAEKDDMLRYIEGEIERVQGLYEERERALTLEKDKAVDNIHLLTREKITLQAELKDLLKQKKCLEEKENDLKEAFGRQGIQLAELSSQLSSAMAMMHAQTNAREKMKTLYSSKVSELCKALEELQNVEVLTEEPSGDSAKLVPEG